MGRGPGRKRHRGPPAPARQRRLRCGLERPLPRPVSGRTLEGRGHHLRAGQGAWRGDGHPPRPRGRRHLCPVGGPQGRHREGRLSAALDRPSARRAGRGVAGQAGPAAGPPVPRQPPAQGAPSDAAGDQSLARGARQGPAVRPGRAGGRDQGRPADADRGPPDRARHLDGGRGGVRCGRRRPDAHCPARRLRGRRDARLGGSDRRLPAAGQLRHRRRGGPGRAPPLRKGA
jgi:hypothetical protein